MTDKYDIITGGTELQDKIAPMWEFQRLHHVKVSTHFSAETARITWAERKEGLLKRAMGMEFRIEIVREGDQDIGYYIAVAAPGQEGEVESLHVRDEFRGKGIGGMLMKRCIAWIKDVGTKSICLFVAEGNDKAFAFYERLGFRRRAVKMVLKES